MEQTHLTSLKKNTVISALSLFFQSGYSAVLGLVANIVLTIVVSPTIFGIYIVVLSIISLLNYFSDIGLAASLVQKKEVTDEDVITTFTVQQTLIVSLIGIGFLLTSFIMKFYKLPAEGAYLYWALLLSFFISSLKTIPSIFLERQVQFQKIVMVQILENTLFYIVVTVCALLRFGLQSFTIAVLVRSISGLIAMYTISFWMPRLGISKKSLKSLLAFGLPFQASSFLAIFKDELITLFLGKVVGLAGVGYIGWAKKWAEAPIRIIMDNLSRVLFPTLSRLQHDMERVGRVIEKMLYYQTLLLAPILIGMAIVMPHIVFLIPKYAKWAPAIPLFYLFCVSAFFSSYSTPFVNLFNAVGRVKISFGLMVYWTVMTWIFTPTLTKFFGLLGFPMTQVFLSLAFIYVIVLAKRIAPFRFWQSVRPSLISTVLMGVSVFGILWFAGRSWLAIIGATFVGVVVYSGALIQLFAINPIREVRSLFSHE